MAYSICVLRAPGTNCDAETAMCIESLGVKAEVVHLKKFINGLKRLTEFDGLIIPGGFSFGDHVRAGALLGKILKERFGNDMKRFSDQGNPILGICNGFQALVECGLLPGDDMDVALTRNLSSRFECRWVHLKTEKTGCIYTKDLNKAVHMPVAHGEGRFLANPDDLSRLRRNRQIVFRYAFDKGKPASGSYPANPNGSADDIAGICNPSGTVMGLMPHPERAFYSFTSPCWTRENGSSHGSGNMIFKNLVDYLSL